jgi:hypothetical protein
VQFPTLRKLTKPLGGARAGAGGGGCGGGGGGGGGGHVAGFMPRMCWCTLPRRPLLLLLLSLLRVVEFTNIRATQMRMATS